MTSVSSPLVYQTVPGSQVRKGDFHFLSPPE